jgi:transcriptional regulator with XRE-family HTH domain
MLSINIQTPISVMQQLKERFREKRLFMELTQEGLAKRSGVSLGSIKRFESSAEISLKSFLKLALVLECLDNFTQIAQEKPQQVSSIDELLKTKYSNKKPKRGKIK